MPETLVPTVVLGVLGLVLGTCVQGTIHWVNGASTAPDQYEGLGRGLVSLGIGVPALVAVTLIAFRLARVRLWPVAALTALWLAVAATTVATRLVASTPGDTPVVWPWCAALTFALSALCFQLARRPTAALAIVPVVIGLAVLSGVGRTRQADQWRAKAAASIRATGLPVLTTDVSGYAPISADGAPIPSSQPAGPEIVLTFWPDPPGDRPYLASVWMHTFHRPAWFHPPEDCPTANFAHELPPRPCTTVAPDIWWSDADRSAIRAEGDNLVVLRGDILLPPPKEALVTAAGRVRLTSVDALVAHNR